MDYIQLLGAEKVENAATTVRQAAEQMQMAASSIEYTLSRNQQFMDEWLARLEALLDKALNQEHN